MGGSHEVGNSLVCTEHRLKKVGPYHYNIISTMMFVDIPLYLSVECTVGVQGVNGIIEVALIAQEAYLPS